MKHWWKIDEKVWCVFFPHWFFQDWWKIDEKVFPHTLLIQGKKSKCVYELNTVNIENHYGVATENW